MAISHSTKNLILSESKHFNLTEIREIFQLATSLMCVSLLTYLSTTVTWATKVDWWNVWIVVSNCRHECICFSLSASVCLVRHLCFCSVCLLKLTRSWHTTTSLFLTYVSPCMSRFCLGYFDLPNSYRITSPLWIELFLWILCWSTSI